MEELRQLTAGQKAVVDAYLANYEPAEAYDYEAHVLIDTQTMILHMGPMCNFDENMLCDYLASLGYRTAFIHKDCICGWVLRKKYNETT